MCGRVAHKEVKIWGDMNVVYKWQTPGAMMMSDPLGELSMITSRLLTPRCRGFATTALGDSGWERMLQGRNIM